MACRAWRDTAEGGGRAPRDPPAAQPPTIPREATRLASEARPSGFLCRAQAGAGDLGGQGDEGPLSHTGRHLGDPQRVSSTSPVLWTRGVKTDTRRAPSPVQPASPHTRRKRLPPEWGRDPWKWGSLIATNSWVWEWPRHPSVQGAPLGYRLEPGRLRGTYPAPPGRNRRRQACVWIRDSGWRPSSGRGRPTRPLCRLSCCRDSWGPSLGIPRPLPQAVPPGLWSYVLPTSLLLQPRPWTTSESCS